MQDSWCSRPGCKGWVFFEALAGEVTSLQIQPRHSRFVPGKMKADWAKKRRQGEGQERLASRKYLQVSLMGLAIKNVSLDLW